MLALGLLAASAESETNTAVLTALIGSAATVLVALIGLIGTVLLNRQRRNQSSEAAGEDDDHARDVRVLLQSVAELTRERDTAVAERDACQERERGRHGVT